MNEYQYTLDDGNTTEVLTVNPANWDNLGLTLTRHDVYHSVLRSFTVTIKFANTTGGGYDFIKAAYDSKGIYAAILITIEKLNHDINDYELFYQGNLDFSTGKFFIDQDFIEIAIVDSDILQKFISRDENEFDVLGSKSLDDVDITPLTHDEVNLTAVYINLKVIANVISATSFTLTESNTSESINLELSGVQPVDAVNQVGDDFSIDTLTSTIYTNNNSYGVYGKVIWDFHYGITAHVYDQTSESNFLIKIYYKIYNSGGSLQSTEEVLSIVQDVPENPPTIHDYTFSGTVNCYESGWIPAGGYLEFYTYFYYSPVVHEKIDFVISLGSNNTERFQFNETIPGLSPTTAECIFPFDAFNKGLEVLTSEADLLTSSICDTGGVLEFDAIMSGRHIRKYPTPQLNIKFRDLFKSFDAIQNIGLWYNPIYKTFIIEDKSYFYSSTLLFTLNDTSDLKIQPLISAYYSKITGGFDNTGDYERVQGALEFAVNREYSTHAKAKETKDIQAKYRFDSVGIEELRNMQYITTASEDNNFDNDVFIVRTDGTDPVLPTVGSPLYLGMDVFATYYNTMLTPRQNAIRWGNILSACHFRKESPNAIKAQKTEKQFELAVGGVDENSDIALSELGNRLIDPELYTFNSYLTPAQIAILLANPHGYIRFINNSMVYEGFIDTITLGDYNYNAKFQLIAKGTTENEANIRIFEDGSEYILEDGSNLELE